MQVRTKLIRIKKKKGKEVVGGDERGKEHLPPFLHLLVLASLPCLDSISSCPFDLCQHFIVFRVSHNLEQ